MSAIPDRSPALAGYPVTPPPLPGPVTFDQGWAELTFVHWPVQPESVAHMYPPGTRPDVFADGKTYVGLIPFIMTSTKLGYRTTASVLRQLFGDQRPAVFG